MTVFQIRPHRRGWKAFEVPGYPVEGEYGHHDCGSVAEKRFTSHPFIPILAGDRIAAP